MNLTVYQGYFVNRKIRTDLNTDDTDEMDFHGCFFARIIEHGSL